MSSRFSKTNSSDIEIKQDELTVHAKSDLEQGASSTFGANGWSGSRLGEAHVAYLDLAAKVEQRRREGQSLSPVYRVYLRDRAGTIVSGRTIAVENDEMAVKIASILRRACADVCVKFEVWKGEVLVRCSSLADPPSSRQEFSQRAQQIVIDTEIAMRDSHTALAESKQLLNAIDEWQGDDTAPRRRRP